MRYLAVAATVVLVGCSPAVNPDGGTGGGGGTGGAGGTGGSGGTGGTGGTGGGTGGSGGVALADYCSGWALAQCAWQVRCGAAAAGADCAKLQLPTRLSLVNGRLDCVTATLRAGLDAGRTTYDGVKAAQCFAALGTSVPCARNYGLFVPECAGIFGGTGAPGAPCFASSDCVTGQYCDSTTGSCPGTCRAQVSAGGAPTHVAACEPGTLYRRWLDGGTTCASLVASGQPCGPPPGEVLHLQCAGASACQAAADGGLTCQPLKGAGQSCSIFNDPCALDAPCSATDAGSQCVLLGRSAQPCGSAGCQAGLACVAGTCGALASAGSSCTRDADCVAGHYCPTAGTCQPFVGPDGGCSTAPLQSACGVGLFCSAAARCEVQLGLGATCPGGNECSLERGLTCTAPTDGGASRCAPFMCLPPP